MSSKIDFLLSNSLSLSSPSSIVSASESERGLGVDGDSNGENGSLSL